jgi:type I restriction enzyme, R subunit
LDAKFDAQVPAEPERRERVLRKFARQREILEAPSVIADKADYMLRHWAVNALPDRFGTRGAPISVTTACASGASALQLAVGALRRG